MIQEQKRTRKSCVQVATSSDEFIFFCCDKFFHRRISVDPSSFDAASTSQVRPKDAYFGGFSWKSSGETRRIKKKHIQKTPTILKLRSGTGKGNKLQEKPLPKTRKLGGNTLHTEPILQLIKKVKSILKRHGDITSKCRHTHPIKRTPPYPWSGKSMEDNLAIP